MTRTIIIGVITLSLMGPGFAAEPSKSQTHTFFGIKGGFMKPDGKNNDSAVNIGAGFKIGESGILDVEYTEIDDSVDYISIGYLFNS